MPIPSGKCHPFHNFHFRQTAITEKTIPFRGQEYRVGVGDLYCGDDLLEADIEYIHAQGVSYTVQEALADAAQVAPAPTGASAGMFAGFDVLLPVALLGVVAYLVIKR